MGENSESKKGRRIVQISFECLESWFKGDMIHCLDPLPDDATLIAVRKRDDRCFELSFESFAWADTTIKETLQVYPTITPMFCGKDHA